MSDIDQKTIIVFAGANGAGKTTAAEFLLKNHRIKQFVNADKIAYGLSPFAPETQQIEAGRILLKRIHRLIEAGESFAYETTLSGRSQLIWLKKAKETGYQILLYYISTEDVSINLDRIAQRVQEGGHTVPEEDVRRRYTRSIRNLFGDYEKICDIVEIYDNSRAELALIARKRSPDPVYDIFDFDLALWEKLINASF